MGKTRRKRTGGADKKEQVKVAIRTLIFRDDSTILEEFIQNPTNRDFIENHYGEIRYSLGIINGTIRRRDINVSRLSDDIKRKATEMISLLDVKYSSYRSVRNSGGSRRKGGSYNNSHEFSEFMAHIRKFDRFIPLPENENNNVESNVDRFSNEEYRELIKEFLDWFLSDSIRCLFFTEHFRDSVKFFIQEEVLNRSLMSEFHSKAVEAMAKLQRIESGRVPDYCRMTNGGRRKSRKARKSKKSRKVRKTRSNRH